RPLRNRAQAMLLAVARLAAGRLVLVGAGGIETGSDILARIKAGADLVQVYSAFALQGPALVPRLKTELLAALRAQGFETLADAKGADL
ncbi:dihydroorotate dehydrogenase (quinone), partial [Ameyamaea chiangmaiensis]|nr:dihydroorotate dehydrogenase (quinone) [Ameyamaea chiangmaiensis]